tara:strand:+ start:866 stop:1660 length:795 start_codon:yes stop_codon:yes gene_type:complete
MAINVNTVYQTVLFILNKEQRGYMTPAEFNSVATQVQLEVFNNYFDELNQQLRVPQADVDYADRIQNLDADIQIFKTQGTPVYDSATIPALPYWTLPAIDVYGTNTVFYKLGSVIFTNPFGEQIEIQRLSKGEFYNIELSSLTKASETYPTYLYENEKLFTNPSTLAATVANNTTSSMLVNYIRKPIDPVWGFTIGTRGQYIYDSSAYAAGPPATGSINFELSPTEQINVITKILFYSGVIIEDPQIIQVAASQIQQEQINSKS